MKPREKYLAIALVAIIVFWQGHSLFQSVFVKPFTDRQRTIDTLTTAVGDLKVREVELEEAVMKLSDYGKLSLPPVPETASTLYRNWLLELATEKKLTNVAVTATAPDTKAKGDTYYAIPVNIVAQGPIDKWCDFLFAFHQAPLLQRVVRMTVDSESNRGNPTLKVTLTVEGLALKAQTERTTLLAEGAGDVKREPLVKDRKEYDALIAKNLFVRGYNGPPAPPTPPAVIPAPPADKFDVAEHVYLVAYVAEGDVQEAWLYDRSANKRIVLREGESFDVAGVKGSVEKIGKDFVLLKTDDATWRLEQGQNMKQLKKLPAPATTAAVEM
jgi:hypothetical protein